MEAGETRTDCQSTVICRNADRRRNGLPLPIFSADLFRLRCPWLSLCYPFHTMRRAVFRAEPGKGFVRTTLAPVNDRQLSRFGLADLLMVLALVLAALAIARLLVAR